MRARVIAATVALALAVGACGGDEPTSTATPTDRLEVVSWWTSGSEAAALDTLFAAYRRTNPEVDTVNAAVAGGGGSKAIVALAERLQQDDPPDVWQTFAGESVRGYADRKAVRSLAPVFAGAGLSTTMQPVILASLMRDGRPYGVPTGAHRSNVLWFNPTLLARAGITPPTDGYRLATFVDDLKKVENAGVPALCLGAKDPFTTVALFENILLSTIGVNGWQRMVDDRLDWRSPAVTTALTRFGEILKYADPEAGGLTWDQATEKLAGGGCAFESMNDSAYGELVAGGAKEGEDFGTVSFPGTQNSFLAVVDVFVAATRAENARNALAFLTDIASPATQVEFSRAKGSIPVVSNVDVTALPPYQQNASKRLWGSTVLLSVAHGEAMSPRFQEGFYTAVATYIRTRDPGSFADDLEDAVAGDRVPPR